MKSPRDFTKIVSEAFLFFCMFVAIVLIGPPPWLAVGVFVVGWSVVAVRTIRAVRARKMRLVRPGLRSFRFARVRDLIRFCAELEVAGYDRDATVDSRYFWLIHEEYSEPPEFHISEQIILVDDAMLRFGVYTRGSRGTFTVPPEPVLITYEE